jgi:energy-converting hydrogenase Eha subunit E
MLSIDYAFVSFNIGIRVMAFNATFNNISAILLRSVLLMEESGVPGENQ